MENNMQGKYTGILSALFLILKDNSAEELTMIQYFSNGEYIGIDGCIDSTIINIFECVCVDRQHITYIYTHRALNMYFHHVSSLQNTFLELLVGKRTNKPIVFEASDVEIAATVMVFQI